LSENDVVDELKMNTYHNNNNEGIQPVLIGNSNNNHNVSSIPNEATWKLLRETYERVFTNAEYDDSNDDYQYQEYADYFNSDYDDDSWYAFDYHNYYIDRSKRKGGFVVPYEVKNHPSHIEKGRGVFSTGFIPKDSIIIPNFSRPSAFFWTEAVWREFLTSLPLELARDVTQWAYVVQDETDIEKKEPKPNHVVCLDMFAGSLMNHGDTTITASHNNDLLSSSSSSSSPLANIYERKGNSDYYEMQSGIGDYLASRDIHPGDEFLVDYKSFHIKNHRLDWFDSIRNEIFTEDHGFNVLSYENDKSDLL